MFSWSSGVTRRPSGSTTSTYPAQRVAQTVEGSIRPPEYSRSQHIQSYLTDETLKKSTRKVSAGESSRIYFPQTRLTSSRYLLMILF
jgi:hypothetical protein